MKYTQPPKTFEELGTPVMIPRKNKHPDWHTPVDITAAERRVFGILSILRYMLRQIAPQSGWQNRLIQLAEIRHPQIPVAQMGFPENWKDSPIWEDTND